MLTSRNEPRVLDQFDGDAYRFNLSSAANSAATTADVSAFVSRRLAARPHSRTGSGVTGDLAERIVQRAEGNFLYAAWVLDELSTSDGPPTDPIDLPKGLYGLYRTFLDRLVKSPSAFSQTRLDRHEPFFGSSTSPFPPFPPRPTPCCPGGWAGVGPS